MVGAIQTATKEPIIWAYHWRRGGVRRRKPTLKSLTRSEAWEAAPAETAPDIKLSAWACFISIPEPLVTPPMMSWEALETVVIGVVSVAPVHWMARKAKKKARIKDKIETPTG